MKPANIGLSRGPAVTVLIEPRDSAIVDDLALLIAPATINYLPLGDFVDVASNDAVHQLGGAASGEQVFVQRRDIDQRSRIADGVVLVLVVHLVGADRVISRPLAVVEAGTQRKSALVKSRSNGHVRPQGKCGTLDYKCAGR